MATEDTPIDATESLSSIYDTDDLLAYIEARKHAEARAELDALEELELDAEEAIPLPVVDEYDSLSQEVRSLRPRRATLLGLDGYQWSVLGALILAVNLVLAATAIRWMTLPG